MTTHLCPWPGCQIEVPRRMWGCRAHWYRVPKSLRNRIWATYVPGQEVTMTPSREYVLAAKAVRDWIVEHGNG